MKNEIQNYLESPDVTKLAKSSRELYGYALQHLENFCKPRKITKVAGFQEHMPAFTKYLERLRVSGKSIQQYVTITKLFFRWAGLPIDYTYRLSNAEIKANKRKALKRWFTEADIEKCLAYEFLSFQLTARLQYRILVRLMVETGARVRELSSVEAKDIDQKTGTVWLNDSKTEPRPAFFSRETLSLIEAYRKRCTWKGRVFPKATTIKTTIAEMLKNLGLKSPKDGRGCHTFRHWCATKLFYDGGMRIEDIAVLLGDKPETIIKCYLHPTPEMLRRRVAEAMGWEK